MKKDRIAYYIIFRKNEKDKKEKRKVELSRRRDRKVNETWKGSLGTRRKEKKGKWC